MKNLTNTLLLFVFLLTQVSLSAQYSYTQYLMPTPDKLSPLFLGSITESAIYYGAEPAYSSNKPVLVFVHGFTDLANSWFLPGNDIYDEAYDDRFRTAFVATTRGEGMWTNGAILAQMLEDITAYYGVNDVVIVAHSNGGKASEVAMFYENKSHLVNRVISLGTPFKGTGIADLAETPALNWLVDFIGLGGGTSTSTTYYMEGIARPILDNEPDNQPNKFINFGAWGYNKGTTIAAPVMFTGGTYLNLAGGDSSTGGNDGVTPYYSSTRPGGSPQWPGYCAWWWCNDVSQYDHIDITHDYVVWDEIKPFFQGNINGFSSNSEEDELYPQDRKKIQSSNFEILSTVDGYKEAFTISKDAGAVSINLWHPAEENDFVILNENLEAVEYAIQKSKGHAKGMNSTINLDRLPTGTYTIESDAAAFAAVVAYEKGAELAFDNSTIRYAAGEAITLNAELKHAKAADISAVIAQTADLMGNAVEGTAVVVNFEAAGNGQYSYNLAEGLAAGVYNVTLNATGEDFRRNIVAGFVVTAPTQEVAAASIAMELQHYPNPVVEQTTISFEVVTEGTTTLSLYDAYGRLVRSEQLNNLALGQHTLAWNMEALASGTYFLELRNGKQQVTKSLVKVAK